MDIVHSSTLELGSLIDQLEEINLNIDVLDRLPSEADILKYSQRLAEVDQSSNEQINENFDRYLKLLDIYTKQVLGG
jgi:hypothetical protein